MKIKNQKITGIILSVISGVLIFFGFPKVSFFAGAFIAIMPLIYLTETTKSNKRIFLYGYITQIIAMTGGFYWLIYTIKTFGHLPIYAAIPVFLLYISFFGLRIPLFMILAKYLRKKTNLSVFLIYPFTFTAIELIWPDLFPWFLANTQHNNAFFIQIADITGVYGITFVVMLVNTALYHLLTRYYLKTKKELNMLWLGITLFSVILLYTYGILRSNYIQGKIDKATPVKVGTIQPVTPLLRVQRFNKKQEIRKRLFDLSEKVLSQNPIDIFLWPESADQFIYKSPYFKGIYRQPIEELVKKYKIYFMFSEVEKVYKGINKQEELIEIDPYNPIGLKKLQKLKTRKKYLFSTATMLNPKAEIIDSYRKVYPLPFGEYLPFGETFPFLKRIFAEVGNFSAGKKVKVFKTRFGKAAPSICYEIIIPSFTRRFVKKGADFILNQTNDGWFGRTKASYEHLALAKFRAIENRVPIVRSTNSGVSVFISATGRYTTRLTKTYKITTLIGNIRPIKVDTFYTNFGNVFAFLILLYIIVVFGFILYEKISRKVIPIIFKK